MQGAELTSIHDDDENAFVLKLGEGKNMDIWIGALKSGGINGSWC